MVVDNIGWSSWVMLLVIVVVFFLLLAVVMVVVPLSRSNHSGVYPQKTSFKRLATMYPTCKRCARKSCQDPCNLLPSEGELWEGSRKHFVQRVHLVLPCLPVISIQIRHTRARAGRDCQWSGLSSKNSTRHYGRRYTQGKGKVTKIFLIIVTPPVRSHVFVQRSHVFVQCTSCAKKMHVVGCRRMTS